MIRRLQKEEVDTVLPVLMQQANEWASTIGMHADEYSMKLVLRLAVTAPDRACLVNDDLTGLALIREQVWPMDLRVKAVHEMMVAGNGKEELKEAVDAWGVKRGINVVMESCMMRGDMPRMRRVQ